MAINRQGWVSGAVAGALLVLLLLLLAATYTVYTGAYDVAATEEHTPVVQWAFTTTLRNSVERQAEPLERPKSFEQAEIAAGAIQYKAMCEHCHGGPGAPRSNWAEGMRPEPPLLAEVADRWQIHQIFWLVKHGIKMSGMPAFGEHHDDEALWTIAAFVDQLPRMTPEDYAQNGPSPAANGT